MKKNRGISLIELVIVIIILILIAGFAVFSGKDSLDKAEVAEIFAEMTNVKKAVNGVIAQMGFEGKDNDEEWLKDFYNEKSVDPNGTTWYEIYGMDNKRYYSGDVVKVRNNLNMDNLKRSYKVSFETGEIKLSKPVVFVLKISGETSAETYDDIRKIAASNNI